MMASERDLEDLFEERTRLREALFFFASVIRSGERWSPQCDAALEKATAPIGGAAQAQEGEMGLEEEFEEIHGPRNFLGDADFIAASRSDVPDLVAELEESRAEVVRLQKLLTKEREIAWLVACEKCENPTCRVADELGERTKLSCDKGAES